MDCEVKSFICQFFALENAFLWGILFFLLVVLFLLLRRQPQSIVAYKTENGDVTISRSALAELMRTSCQQINYISKPKLKVFTKGGLTHFTVQIQLTSGARLKDIEETLQNHFRESLANNLGIEKLGTVNITVTGFKSSKIQPAYSGSIASVASPTPKEDESDETANESKSS